MLDGMTHRQFAEWIAKDMIEPIGHSGAHDILARIGVLVAAFMGNQDATESMFKRWELGHEPDQNAREDIPGLMQLEAVGWRRG